MNHPEYQIGEFHITTDGNVVYYNSDRTDGAGGRDLWKVEKRDNVLATAEERINERLANGVWPKFVADDQVMIAAISGDAGLTARRLALAIDSDARLSSSYFDHEKAFDLVRGDPAVKQQLERLKAKEDALRERLYAEGVWSKSGDTRQ